MKIYKKTKTEPVYSRYKRRFGPHPDKIHLVEVLREQDGLNQGEQEKRSCIHNASPCWLIRLTEDDDPSE